MPEKPPSLEEMTWALDWALGQIGDGPPDPNWRGFTGEGMANWATDKIEAGRILQIAQDADVVLIDGPPCCDPA